jgi:transcription antitermination factor NusG
VKDKEIEMIKKFLNDYENVEAAPISLQADTKVRIQQGAFMDQQATVIKVLKNKVQVLIESIGYSLTAFVDKSNVAITGKQ